MDHNNRGVESGGNTRPLSLMHIGSQQIRLIRLDTLEASFPSAFEQFRAGFLRVLAHSYETYYGDDYHVKRIMDGRSILYFAQGEHDTVGVSYVKRNCRRGGTAVFPDSYRRHGLAEALIRASFLDFPDQYSLLSETNYAMIRLLCRVGFAPAVSIEQVRAVTDDGFHQLSDFVTSSKGVTFKRYSAARSTGRETLTLLLRSAHANTR